MTGLHITRMHGCWNIYGVVEDLDRRIEKELEDVGGYNELARAASDTFYGVSPDEKYLDGILVINRGNNDNYRMRIFNPDGSEAEMCGNGARIAARYLFDRKMVKRRFLLEAYDGSIVVSPRIRMNNNNEFTSATIDMGKGEILGRKHITISQGNFAGYHVSIGNPHFVFFTEYASEEMARKFGPAIEKHSEFPNRTNVEFAKIKGPELIDLYVWERGAGFTQACGTGACATAFAAYKEGSAGRDVEVALPGGVLDISVQEDDTIRMTGPAEYMDDKIDTIPDVREYVELFE